MDNIELKPCPFCGSKAVIKANKKICVWCQCTKCNAITDGYFPNINDENTVLENIEKAKKMAISNWNIRARGENK